MNVVFIEHEPLQNILSWCDFLCHKSSGKRNLRIYPLSLCKMHDGLSMNSKGNANSSPWRPAPSSRACEHERPILKPSNSRGSTSSSMVSDGQSCQDEFFWLFHHSADSMVTCSAPPESSSDSGLSGQLPTSGRAIYFPPGGQPATHPLIPRPRPGLSQKGGCTEPCMQKPIYPFVPSYIHLSRHDSTLLPLIPPYSSSHSVSSSQRSYSTSTLDSKYPSALHMPELGIITYDSQFGDDEEQMNVPVEKVIHIGKSYVSWRGLSNLLSLIALIGGTISLFVVYPVFAFYRDNDRNSAIINNPNVNTTGQAEELAADSWDRVILTFVPLLFL
jgi:hypothetical protein